MMHSRSSTTGPRVPTDERHRETRRQVVAAGERGGPAGFRAGPRSRGRGCTSCSQDDLVKAPLGVLWYGDENGYVLRNHGKDNIRPQVSNGRVFGLQQLGKRAVLFAYDA